jgi:hypothetical protein
LGLGPLEGLPTPAFAAGPIFCFKKTKHACKDSSIMTGRADDRSPYRHRRLPRGGTR